MRYSMLLLIKIGALSLLIASSPVQGQTTTETSAGRVPKSSVPEGDVRNAIRAAMPLIEKGAMGSAEHRKCFTCHHQAMPILVMSEAKRIGFEVDPENLQRQIDHTHAHLRRGKKNYLAGKGQGGQVDTAGYALWALTEQTADEVTDAVVEYLIQVVRDEQHWSTSSKRPPSESSNVTASYVAMRGLKEFARDARIDDVEKFVEPVLSWLDEQPKTLTEDLVFGLRLRSLLAPDDPKTAQLADDPLNRQREDGGWSQTSEMQSDAYATGTAIVALYQAKRLKPNSSAATSAIRFLLNEQQSDGSWHVKSRSKPFQEYFETGYPHGDDQFISMSAACWSTWALLLGLDQNGASPKAEPPEKK